ncbi:MAG: hypothetical protein LUG26_07845 [Ruminococcus sp.]|nr:hypothetical protein [Ruminococcus sp.]
MTVNTKLSLFDYLAMVENIASEFIDEKSGVYQPHIGQLNAMRLFYNFCVTESKFDDKYEHNIVDAEDMEEIVADEEFIEAFNNAIRPDVYLDICCNCSKVITNEPKKMPPYFGYPVRNALHNTQVSRRRRKSFLLPYQSCFAVPGL